MTLPDISGLPEKIGVFGTMLFIVLWLLWQNIRHESAKVMTPDTLSKRMGMIEEALSKIGWIETRLATIEITAKLAHDVAERQEYKLRDLDQLRERVAALWFSSSKRRDAS